MTTTIMPMATMPMATTTQERARDGRKEQCG
jgi:hypothetical protein